MSLALLGQCVRRQGTAGQVPHRILTNIEALQLHLKRQVHRSMASQVETITVNERRYRAVKEGLASILAPYRESNQINDKYVARSNRPKNNDEGDQAVFYNPIQQYNRDLSVLAILTYGEGAVLEKEARFKINDRRRDRRKRNKAEPLRITSVEPNSKKRKSEDAELEDHSRPVESTGKRNKIEGDADGDEMPVQQLNGGSTSESDQSKAANLPNDTVNDEESVETKPRRIPFTILDALSASGLRAIRYAKEIPFTTNVIANDLSAEAVKSIELNIDHNNLRGKVHSNVGDARAYMYSKIGSNRESQPGHVHQFDVVDLDPYGTAAPFLDAAIQCVIDGGLLCVTCTDAGVFASNGYPEKAYALYGGIPLKGVHSHEAGLRLILHAISTSAAKYGLSIEPLLSLSIDFYARLFVRVHKSQQEVKLLAGTTMMIYNCDQGCGAWETQLVARNRETKDKIGNPIIHHGFSQGPSVGPSCVHCGSKTHLGGPLWAGPLHNPYFIQRMLDKLPNVEKSTYATVDRIEGMLTLALEEDLTLARANTPPPNDTNTATQEAVSEKIIPRLPPNLIDSTPFFFIPNYIAKVIHCQTPGENALRGAIRHLGYRVTRSHCKPGSFKTDAPFSVIWEIMREWVRQKEPHKIPKLLGEGEFEGKPMLDINKAGYRIMKRLRGTERHRAGNVADEVRRKLEHCKFSGDPGDVEAVLKAALWELEHTKQQEPTSAVSEDDKSQLKVIFDEALGKEKPRDKLVRYQINPRANWGPMNRAGGHN